MDWNNKFNRQKRLVENRKHKQRMLMRYARLKYVNKNHHVHRLRESHRKQTWFQTEQSVKQYQSY